MSEVTQSCSTLCNPMDCSLPGFSVHGILQARILEWITISFSRGSSQARDQTRVSHIGGRHFNLWATREAPNNGIYMFSSILVSLGYMPRSGIAESYGGFILSCLRNLHSNPSSIVAISIYIPTNSARVFPFLHTLSSIYCL